MFINGARAVRVEVADEHGNIALEIEQHRSLVSVLLTKEEAQELGGGLDLALAGLDQDEDEPVFDPPVIPFRENPSAAWPAS